MRDYPEDRYTGTTGEPSAVLRREGTPADLVTRSTTAHYLTTGEATDGQFGLYRWEMAGGRGGPDPHFHRSITESFYVLSGTVSLYDGNAHGPTASRSRRNARIRSTASCWRCIVTTEWPLPSNSTAMKLSPISLRRVSKRVPVAGSLR
jgi:hypothetical protein